MLKRVLASLSSLAVTAAVALPGLPATAVASEQTTTLGATDYQQLVRVQSPVLTATGETLCWIQRQVSTEKDQSVASIWCKKDDGVEKAVTLSNGVQPDKLTFIAGSSTLSWLGTDVDSGSQQVFTLALSSGNVTKVTAFTQGVSDFSWAPTGKQVAVAASNNTPQVNAAGTPAPIEIDRFNYIGPWSGYVSTQPEQLFIVDTQGETVTQLTDTNFNHWHVTWSPDGSKLAYFSYPDFAAERINNSELYVFDVKAGKETRFTYSDKADGMAYWPAPLAWSPDSQQLAWVERTPEDASYYGQKALLVGNVKSGRITPVARIDRNFDTPSFTTDGKRLLALQEDNMAQWLVEIDIASDTVRLLNPGAHLTSGYTVSGDESRLIVAQGNDDAPAALFEAGSEQALINPNQWLADYTVANTNAVQIQHSGVTVDALVTLPAYTEILTPLPTIVLLHGGPVFQFFHQFSLDAQVYAAQGYAVVQVNPRGSSGKGLNYSLPIFNNWGTPDVADVLAVVNSLAEQGIVDIDKVGVGGWSYGGILTNWSIAKSNLFKAAVSGAGVSTVLGFYGNDVFSADYEQELGTPWKNTDAYLRYSYPLLHADQINTPTLFQCAGIDSTVPCMGAKQMYLALKSQDKATHLTIYPNQGHMLTTPSYIVHRLEQSLAWFSQYLLTE
ncbi:S9 family peptidase [Alteromonas lipolytica]|uniref:Peptidase S9 prolyl oligopeptidase catalytic domain-containing protein n=1 Tax=Alteromonas lipolytica TaxID=1856405 RepID=A0A1E8FIN1_9ALTE|nr:S9 family peptidase [Alteromonas lipolytica]OFI35468.1 hypothetical protein BFC17_11925 [Alteromonas lipolytica]GGF76500.1 acylaminoacyl-peptidase [Alteromonas lipolytica]